MLPAVLRTGRRIAIWAASPAGRRATATSGSINGQKVWSSGARFAEWGELIARSDPDAPKHKGLTAFIIPMDLPGIEIRPIRR